MILDLGKNSKGLQVYLQVSVFKYDWKRGYGDHLAFRF